ncbi:MAG: DUF5615 family PIN-like protein [Bacteroidota bacterium]
MILADEGLNGKIVKALRDNGLAVDWILELSPGVKDEEVIAHAKRTSQILITEDKDFGEWVFAHKVKGLTIIFLRYQKADFPVVLANLHEIVSALVADSSDGLHEFITIGKHKVRRRIL